jgi:hypothetical protein
MIQRGNAVYQTLILEALSATVENFAVDVFDVVNKGYLDSRLSSVNIIDVGGGVSLVAGDNTIRTLSGGPGVTLLSSAQVVALSTNVVSATNIGPSSAIQVYKDNIDGTLRFKSLSSGYGVHIADEISAVSIRVGYEKTEQTVLSSVGVFAVTVPENTYSILIEAAGGGGGGGGGGHGSGNSGYGGGGGGGGAYTTLTLSGSQVFGLTTLSATIGSGGSGGPGGTNSGSSPGTTGSTGGTTSVSSTSILLSAVGGAGGVGGQYSEGSGGSGGGAGGTPNGGNGGNGAYSTGSVFPAANGTSTFTPGGGGGGGVIGGGNYAAANGGTGSAISGSVGGDGAGPSGTGANGVLGGGGGGGGGTPYTFPGAGGNGGNGFVRITFYIREGEYKNAGNGVQILNEPLHEIRTLSAAGGIALLSSTDVITISSSTESLTASNVGVGQGVFKQRTGNTLEFYSLSAGGNIAIIPVGDTLVFDVSGGGGTIDNIGTGIEIGVEGTNQLRTLSAGTGIQIVSGTDGLTIVATGSSEVVTNSVTKGAFYYYTTNQTISSGYTIIGFISSTYDTLSGGSGSGPGWSFTVPEDGHYVINYNYYLTTNTTALTYVRSGLTINNGDPISHNISRVYGTGSNVNASTTGNTAFLRLSAGDVLRVVGATTISSGQLYTGTDILNYFSIIQVGGGLTNTGNGVQLVDNTLGKIRTLSAVGSVSILSGTDVITISGSGGAIDNIGTGTALGVQGTNQFRTLSAVGSLILLSGTDVITLSAGGGGGGGGGGFGEPVQVYDINGNIVEVGSIVPRDPDPRFLWLFT